MTQPRLLLLYGLDEKTLPVDAECTREMIPQAAAALSSRGWRVETCLVTDDLESALAPYPAEDWVVFNLCEGSPSQAFYYASAAQALERSGHRFTGSGSICLDQNQSKPHTKRLLEAQGLATPGWTTTLKAHDLVFGRFPAIVKPAAEHCSFGITHESVVFDLAQARKQAEKILPQFPGGVLVEEFLDSPEYAVSLWGDTEDVEILGISTISYEALPDIRDRLCTFEAKWLPETEVYQKTMPVCPAPIESNLKLAVESLARRAYIACGLRDYGRVDLRLRDKNPLILDVNANPALSPNSGLPDTARIAGYDYGTFLDSLARKAAHRSTPRTQASLA